MTSEIASVQSVVKKRKRRERRQKNDLNFSVETFFDRKNIFFLHFFLLPTLNFSLQQNFFISLSFRKCTFLEECFCVRFFLCICASELQELFVVSNETRRCLRRRAKWCCRCCCPPPPPPREDDNTTEEEFYEDGSVTRAGVATTMKTTTTMGI